MRRLLDADASRTGKDTVSRRFVFFVFALAAFGITVLLSKKVSLGSLMGCVGALIAVFLFAPNPLRIWMTVIAALIIIVRHSANIHRLAEGKEKAFRPSLSSLRFDGGMPSVSRLYIVAPNA